MEVMNRIDQKIEHLKYLYDKRIKHNQVAEEEIKRIKEEQENNLALVEYKARLEEINTRLYRKDLLFGVIGIPVGMIFLTFFLHLSNNIINPFFNSLMPPVAGLAFAPTLLPAMILEAFVALGLLFGPPVLSLKIGAKSKNYKRLMQEATNLTAQIQLAESEMKKAQDHLMNSNQEVERLQQLLEDFEKERDSLKENIVLNEMNQLKEQLWRDYIPTETDLDRMHQIQENSKSERQKILK